MKEYIGQIFSILGEEKRRLPALVSLFLVASLLDLAGLAMIGPLIGIASDPNYVSKFLEILRAFLPDLRVSRASLLMGFAYGLIVVFLVKACAGIWINRVIVRFCMDQEVRLRDILLRGYQQMPYSEFVERNSSEYIYSIHSLTGTFAGHVLMSFLKTVSEVIVAVAVVGFLFFQDFVTSSLLIGVVVPVMFVYDRFSKRLLKKYGRELNESALAILRNVQESMRGFKEIRILGVDSFFRQSLLEPSRRFGDIQVEYSVIRSAPRYLLELMLVSLVVLILITSIGVDGEGATTFQTLGVFGLAAARLMPMANTVASALAQFRFHRDAVERLFRDLRTRIGSQYAGDPPELSEYKEFKRLNLKNVSYRYRTREKFALKNISIEIESGECIGIIGESGSGKSTLVDLFLGLLEPTNGSVEFNAEPLENNLAHWWSQVAYLPQENFLLDDSIGKNVSLELGDLNEAEIARVMEKTQLADFLEDVPEKLNSRIGDGGIQLSGGQRQRIALARALYRRRGILILDEATSALDSHTEAQIFEQLRQLKGAKTLILIAHRLSTLRMCDKIYEVESGTLQFRGSGTEVIEGYNATSLH